MEIGTGRCIRIAAFLALGTALACAMLAAEAPFALARVARTKTCQRVSVCSSSVSSPAPLTPVGGSGGGGGGGGPTSPPPPPAPFSNFLVAARPSSAGKKLIESAKLTQTVNSGSRLRCAGYTPRDPSWFQWLLTSTSKLTITYEITDRIANTTPRGLRFCYGAPHQFKTFSGRPARRAKLPDGTMGYIGLLPMCVTNPTGKNTFSGPCMDPVTTSRDPSSATGIDIVLKVHVPNEAAGDPWGKA
jgi:hypothetical protein